MAMEIIIQAEIDEGNQFEQQENYIYSAIDDELNAGREKDSGHWSSDYTLQPENEEKSTSTLSPTSSDADTNPFEDETLSTGAQENTAIPIPPPLPPLKGYAAATISRTDSLILLPSSLITLKGNIIDYDELQILDHDELQVHNLSANAASCTVSQEVADDPSQCCIVCFDPNTVTEYDDFDYDIYMEVHRKIESHLTLPCCKRLICASCVDGIISTLVGEGRVQISCPHPECDKPFTKEYILSNISSTQVKQKYQQFLVDVENDGKRKTCPKCCHITEHQLPKRIRQREQDLKIDCEVCHQEWCFRCHAPWHKDVSCRQFQKGNKDFRKWTKGNQRGIANCQKCPTCRVYIQRSTGCHQMKCNRCDTGFCYDCGGRFLELGIIEHESTLNIWGCPDNYHKDEPFIRHSVRWGYLTAKLSYLIAYPPLFVGACGLLALGAVIFLPVYGGFKLYSYSKFKRANKRRRRN